MKKGLKALSAVLALSMGLVGANLVSAQTKFYFTDHLKNGLTEKAAEYISLPNGSVSKFYTSLTNNKAFKWDLQEAEAALDELAEDATNHAAINTAVCNAAQAIESIDNELRASAHLRALAETYRVGLDVENKPHLKEAEDAIKLPIFGEHRAKMEKYFRLWNQFKGHVDTATATAEDVSDSYGIILQPSMTKDNLKKAIIKEAKLIESADYKKAAALVSKYLPENANAQVMRLRAERTKLIGLIQFGKKLLEDRGMKLDACELPEDLLLGSTPATKEVKDTAKKDSLPNTAATEWKVLVPANRIIKYFPEIVPCACAKKDAKKATSAYTFEQLRNMKLVPSCCSKLKAKPEMKSAFTFEGLRNLDLVPCCR